jgi:hypothetical protein
MDHLRPSLYQGQQTILSMFSLTGLKVGWLVTTFGVRLGFRRCPMKNLLLIVFLFFLPLGSYAESLRDPAITS